MNQSKELTDWDLIKLLAKNAPDKYGGLKALAQQIRHNKKPFSYDMPDLSTLPPGQRRAMDALIGDAVARTYPEAARLAGMSEGTLLTHVNRVRQRQPMLYKVIRSVRLAQLAQRHEDALAGARAHSAIYFKTRRWDVGRGKLSRFDKGKE